MIWILIIGGLFIFAGFTVFFGAPYVPSQRRFVRRAFENLYKLSPRDVLVDVGSGDGIVLRIASEKGARAIGYELQPLLVLISRFLSRRDKKVIVTLANFWLASLPDDTTIVYAFAVSRDGKKMIKKMQAEANRLGRDLRFMCFGSPLPGLKPDKLYEAYHLYTFHPLHSSQAQV